jgi:hypothetical protein
MEYINNTKDKMLTSIRHLQKTRLTSRSYSFNVSYALYVIYSPSGMDEWKVKTILRDDPQLPTPIASSLEPMIVVDTGKGWLQITPAYLNFFTYGTEHIASIQQGYIWDDYRTSMRIEEMFLAKAYKNCKGCTFPRELFNKFLYTPISRMYKLIPR